MGRKAHRLYLPRRGFELPDLRGLWRYRHLVWTLTKRDIVVRYKQTLFGVLWALIQPAGRLAVLAVVFGRLVGVPSDGVPYPLFVYCGLLPWGFFATALTRTSHSLVAAAPLINRIFFPRLTVPVAASLAPLVDLMIAAMLLVGLALAYAATPSSAAIHLPLLVFIAWAAALGTGLWFAAGSVHYRDLAQILPFLTQLGLFATPIIYPAQLVPLPYRRYLALNPMATVVQGIRAAVLGTTMVSGSEVLLSLAITALLLGSGLFAFQRMERSFADLL
jgi:lipopolysaccharide transport system permease protein